MESFLYGYCMPQRGSSRATGGTKSVPVQPVSSPAHTFKRLSNPFSHTSSLSIMLMNEALEAIYFVVTIDGY